MNVGPYRFLFFVCLLPVVTFLRNEVSICRIIAIWHNLMTMKFGMQIIPAFPTQRKTTPNKNIPVDF